MKSVFVACIVFTIASGGFTPAADGGELDRESRSRRESPRTMIKFDSPVAAERLARNLSQRSLSPVAFENGGPIGGGFLRGTLEVGEALDVYERLFRENGGEDLRISSVLLEGEVSTEDLGILAKRVSERRVAQAGEPLGVPGRVTRQERSLAPARRQLNQELTPPGQKQWVPSYGKVHGIDTGDPDLPKRIYNEMTWTTQESIDAFPESFAYEHDFWEHNEALSTNLRPWCNGDDIFWATRGSNGQPLAWFWNLPEEVDPYMEAIDEFDSCQDMDLTVGMFTPRNLEPNVRYWTAVYAQAPIVPVHESQFVLRSAALDVDCPNDPHVQQCVGLPPYGDGEYLEPLIGVHDAPAEVLPGCFRWTRSIGSEGTSYNECYDVTADAPTGYWRLGEVADSTARGEVGPDGHYTASVRLGLRGALRGDPDHAVGFDGGGSVVFPYAPQFDTSELTAEAWVRPSGNSGNQTVIFRQGVFHLGVSGGRVRASLLIDNSAYTHTLEIEGSTELRDGRWHHVAVTFDGNAGRVYVDGEQDALPQSAVGRMTTATSGLKVGEGYAGYVGEIDEVATYGRALAESDFAKRFSHRWGPPTGCNGTTPYTDLVCRDMPIGYWRMHDGSLNPAADLTDLQGGDVGADVALLRQRAIKEQGWAIGTSGTGASVVTVPYETYGTYATDHLTIETWVRFSISDWVERIAVSRGAFRLGVKAGKAIARINLINAQGDTAEPVIEGRNAINDGRWHHLALTYDGIAPRLFVDGVLQRDPVGWQGRVQGYIGSGIRIGQATYTGDAFIGDIDEVALYERALLQPDFEARFQHRWQPTPNCVGIDAYTTEVCADAPIGYWRLGETSGLTAPDHAQIRGGNYGPDVVLGRTGALAGASDTAVATKATAGGFVTIPYEEYGTYATKRLTVEAWVKFSAGDWVERWAVWRGSFKLGVRSGKVFTRLNLVNDEGATRERYMEGATPINDGRWHHIALTYDGTYMKLFVDGAQDVPPVMRVGSVQAYIGNAIRIGQGSYEAEAFVGEVDEVALYDHAIVGERLRAHWAAARS